MKSEIVNFDQGSQEWKEFRRKSIGGSDVGARTPSEIEKVIQSKLGIDQDLSHASKYLNMGHEGEEKVRAFLNESLKADFKPVTLKAVDYPYHASLDGLDERLGAIEIKTTQSDEVIEAVKGGEWPERWIDQLHWGMMISGAKLGNLYCFDARSGQLYQNVVMYPNEEQQAKLMARADSILLMVEDRKSLPVTTTSEYQEFIQTCFKVKQLEDALEELKEKRNKMGKDLLALFSTDKIETDQVHITNSIRKGNVDYSRIPELQGIDLDQYRKKDSQVFTIKLK